MCIICVEIQKERLMLHEAWRNFTEMYETMDKDHALEVFYKLRELQLEENKKDET